MILLTIVINNVFASSVKDTLKIFPFEPVVVTGTRIETPITDVPLSITVIPNKIIKAEEHVPLLNIVSENVPGLFVTQRSNIGYGISSGAAGQISIRGMGGNPNTQVVILIDGRPDIMSLFGHPLSDVYSLYNVKRIEVVRGPASLLYGSNAMGGAINIITDHSHQPGIHFSIPIRYSSFNTKHGTLQQTYEGKSWGYSLAFGYKSSDGFREKGNDSYDSKNGMLELHSKIFDSTHLFLNGYISDYKIYDPGQISNPFNDHYFDVIRRGVDLTIKNNSKYFFGDLKILYNSGHHEIWDGYKSDDFTSGLVATETYKPNDNLKLLMGLDVRYYGGKALIDTNWNDYDTNERSAIFQYHQKLFNALNIDGGLRFIGHSVSKNKLIKALGFSFNLPYSWILKTEYSEGYRNPTINELYMFTPSTTDLKPETSQNFEIVVEKTYKEILRTSVTAYQIESNNLIEKFGFPPKYQNKGKIQSKGIEWEGTLLLLPKISINWTASASSLSEKIAGSPGEKVDLSVKYTSLANKFSATLQGQWINNLYSVENPYSYAPHIYILLDPYIILHLRSSVSINQYLDVYFSIENIADVNYETIYGFPMPGRTFTTGITAKY
jgi:iron complex outermembrane receptor protein